MTLGRPRDHSWGQVIVFDRRADDTTCTFLLRLLGPSFFTRASLSNGGPGTSRRSTLYVAVLCQISFESYWY